MRELCAPFRKVGIWPGWISFEHWWYCLLLLALAVAATSISAQGCGGGWPPKPRSHLSDAAWLLTAAAQVLLMHSAQPPCVQEFAWLHDRPPCRNSLTGVPGGLEGKNMRVCGGALREGEKNYTFANCS